MKNNLNMSKTNFIDIIEEKKSSTYRDGEKSFKTKYETTDERIIEREFAKPLMILSAYLITAAMIKPPTACEMRRLCKGMI